MVELLRPFEHLAAKPRPEDIRLPTFIVELARETLRRVEPRVREILAAASILGGTFGLGSLSQLVETSPHELLELLERATDIRWVMRVHDDPDHFSFKHNVIREVLYRDTPSVVRVRLHARAARTLADRMSRGDGSISIQAIAHHLLAGVPVVSALEAALSAREAAMAGAHSGSHSEASELMRRAVAVLCTHAATETEALRETLLNLARYERLAGEPFSEHLAQAIKLAPRSRTHLPRV
jgi:predicted ATPase